MRVTSSSLQTSTGHQGSSYFFVKESSKPIPLYRLLEASLDCIANKIYKVMNNPYFKDILAKTELAGDLFRAVAKKMEKADLEHDSTLVQGPEEMFYYTIE